MMQNRIRNEIQRMVDMIRHDQAADGSWKYPFDTGISTDCYMIILLRTLGIHEENLIKGLTERILSKQGKDGGWKLFYDEEQVNVSATTEAYSALLYSEYYQEEDPRLLAAKNIILANGGIQKCHMFTKFMLAMTGHVKWPDFFPLPIEFILLPQHFPVHLFHLSVFGRANLIPLMILADKKFQLKTEQSPNLSAIVDRDSFEIRDIGEWQDLFSLIQKGVQSLIEFSDHLHKQAVEKAKEYMIARIEGDGTFSSYFSATFLMIFALLSLGYKKTDPRILRAVNGLKEMKCEINNLPHMQYTTAGVWNTSLLNTALLQAGVPVSDLMIVKAFQYLQQRQHVKYGDWAIHNRGGRPGGWGFSHINTFVPDVDDTTAVLRSLSYPAAGNQVDYPSWQRGIDWILTMQNKDGGWPAFERQMDNKLLTMLPIDGAAHLIADPSTPDLTGRTLEFLGRYTNIPRFHQSMNAGINWLINHQEDDGSWYGRWGICYIYGTWASVTGLVAAGVNPSSPAITNAVRWMKQIQHDDGGWGESCMSDSRGEFKDLSASTLIHTAWVLDALIAVYDHPTKEIRRGLSFLLHHLDREEDWTTAYPAGQGMAGAFYIHYHSYRYIFPLFTLVHYDNKYGSHL